MEDNLYRPMRVADMAENDKPREKALAYGVRSLSEAELIAIALGSGIVGKSVIDVSREILASVDNEPARLACMTPHYLASKFKGIGPAKAVQLAAAIELGMRVSSRVSYSKYKQISGGSDVFELMRDKLRVPHEEVWLLVLDHRNRVKDQVCLSRGGIAATVVDIRLLFHAAIERLAAAIILVHNHPSGNLYPSIQDNNLTQRVSRSGELLDLKLIDHVIVTEEGYYSYSENGKL